MVFDRARPFSLFSFLIFCIRRLTTELRLKIAGDRFPRLKKAIVAVTIAEWQKNFDLLVRNEEDRRWVANYPKVLAHPGRGRLLFPVRDGRSRREYLVVNLGSDRNIAFLASVRHT
ncbi:hypothetical protein MAE30S32_47520 [Microcystis aeruginosa 11-30S32]|uniref:Uncharacterized protein n=1 Tax=Microcystis aeruginosa 11-30S32 TaxID=2358142 RepID=A0A510PRH4_MICAE|nr:hypothetical protein MAE30S32_47520 [Microcystis aeruginosa 11-30S32]